MLNKNSGKVKIQVEIKEPTKQFLLHSADLEIKESVFSEESGTNTFNLLSQIDNENETLTLINNQIVQPQKGYLTIKFSGKLNDEMRGFYRTKYFLKGEEKYAAVTQFEATDARRAFPCWDEPDIKATFNVCVIGPKNHSIISNMPEKSCEIISNDNKLVQFEKSPIMSTYLVGFVVSEFEFLEKTTSDDRINVRVCVPIGKKNQGEFALEMAVRTIPFFENWFGINYPLPKIDLVAIPDFNNIAMEK